MTHIDTANMTPAEMAKVIAELAAKNDALQAASQKKLSLKVSEKGAVSLYGMNNRFPVTLYAAQWERLLDQADHIRAFIAANKHLLSYK